MKRIRITVLAALICCLLPIYSSAQEHRMQKDEHKFSVEIDPATFAFKGYSAHLRMQPKKSDHILIGFGTYAMNMPSFFVDLNPVNRSKGWNVRINSAMGIFGEFHFTEVNRKWFTGTQVSIQEYRIKNQTFEGSSTFSNLLLMAYGGYTFQPFNFGFYIKPWAGVGYTTIISGDNTLGDMQYDISPISVFATLHVGYAF